MAAHVILQIKQLRCIFPAATGRSDMNHPVILKGIKGVDYVLVEVVAAAAGSIAIGDIVYFNTFPTTVTVGADDQKICGIIPNTVKNLKALAKNNTGTALTKDLFFGTDFIEVALVIKSMIVEGKFEGGAAIVEHENLMPGATGAFIASDDTSSTCGVALHNADAGTGTSSAAVIICPAYGLATKT